MAVGDTVIAAGGRADVQTSLDSVEKLVVGGGPSCPVGSTEVDIGDNFFDPQTVNIPTGGTVCWIEHRDDRPHGHIRHACVRLGMFDPEIYLFTFMINGMYDYHCNFYLFMMIG